MHRIDLDAIRPAESGFRRDIVQVSADEIIAAGNTMTLAEKSVRQVAAKESGNAGDEDVHG